MHGADLQRKIGGLCTLQAPFYLKESILMLHTARLLCSTIPDKFIFHFYGR